MSTKLQTLNYLILQIEWDLEELSWQIREETNYEDNSVDYLSDQYDDKEQQLKDLIEIKEMFVNDNI